MKLIRKKNIEPIKNAEGEIFYEMLGRGEKLGNAIHHSVGHSVLTIFPYQELYFLLF